MLNCIRIIMLTKGRDSQNRGQKLLLNNSYFWKLQGLNYSDLILKSIKIAIISAVTFCR